MVHLLRTLRTVVWNTWLVCTLNTLRVRPFVPSLPMSSKLMLLLPENQQTEFCIKCFDEVCSRCSTSGEGVAKRYEVRINGLPVCAQPPPGATAQSSGTTLADITLAQGYFRASNQSQVVRKCYQANACRGGDKIENYCASGYMGPCEKACKLASTMNYHVDVLYIAVYAAPAKPYTNEVTGVTLSIFVKDESACYRSLQSITIST